MAASHLVLLLVPVADSAPTRVFSVADYGAAGDGSRYDTVAFQATVTACGEARGGCVGLPALRDYVTVPMHLRSVHCAGREHHRSGVTSGGEINGQGGAFVVMPNDQKNVMVSWNTMGHCRGDECCPRLIGFVDSKDVTIHGITLNQPAYW